MKGDHYIKFEGSRFCALAGVHCGLWRSLARGLRLLLVFVAPLTGLAAKTHYVFAHYMVCYDTYGGSVAGYEQEIQEAQAAGIDGFILDIGTWNDPSFSYYNTRVAQIYQAAEQLGTGFKLSFFVEFSNTTNIINLVETFANRTNTFRYNGDIVLSAWGMNAVPSLGWGNGVDWTNDVLNPLGQAGYPIFFIPHFWPPNAPELPSYSDAEFLLNQDGSFVNGLLLVVCSGLPYQLAECNSNYTVALHAANKTFMATYSPHYWGEAQPTEGRRYFETDGGEGTILQWQSLIENQPDWVDLFTWNDFNESTYCSPVMDPEQPAYGEAFLAVPHRYCHAGYLELSKYYITWYKTGKEPQISDALFYFYRTHPKNATALDTNDVPVTWWFGDVEDVIYNTVFLIAPAELEVSSGGTLTTNILPAGISNVRTPFSPGPQWFTLSRGGSNILSVQGPDIFSQITNYDFFPASGYAYGPSNSVWPPTNLKARGRP